MSEHPHPNCPVKEYRISGLQAESFPTLRRPMYNHLKRLDNMGIRFYCPNGHKLNVKAFQAGRRGLCPYCGESMQIPTESTRPSSKELGSEAAATAVPVAPVVESLPQPGFRQSAPEMTAPAAEQGYLGGDKVFAATDQPVSYSVAAESFPEQTASVGSAAEHGVVEAVAPATPDRLTAMPDSHQTGDPLAGASGASHWADPLAEAPGSVWYVRPPSGGQFGPASAEVMRNWLDEGRVGSDALVWREGWQDWREAAETFPQLRTQDQPLGFDGIAMGETATATATGKYRPPSRGQSNTTQAIVITMLILAVIVLSTVFYWVLSS